MSDDIILGITPMWEYRNEDREKIRKFGACIHWASGKGFCAMPAVTPKGHPKPRCFRHYKMESDASPLDRFDPPKS